MFNFVLFKTVPYVVISLSRAYKASEHYVKITGLAVKLHSATCSTA